MEWEQKALLNELTQGMELTKKLKLHLTSDTSPETQELLLCKILSSYDTALSLLRWTGGGEPQTGLPKSPASIDESPRSSRASEQHFDDKHDQKTTSKKRKAESSPWTNQARVCTDSGLEGNGDDGYSWRKYGQKDILGARFPRSYYRCTYRHVQNCRATKQVQRADEDPTVFEVTYKGEHSCHQQQQIEPSVLPPPEGNDSSSGTTATSNRIKQPRSDEMLSIVRPNPRAHTFAAEELDSTSELASPSFFSSAFGIPTTAQDQDFPFSTLVNEDDGHSPSFISQAASGSSYFAESPCCANGFPGVHDLQYWEPDLTEMISADNHTSSAGHSLIVGFGGIAAYHPVGDPDLDFPLDHQGFFL